jgi:hypothetical protein
MNPPPCGCFRDELERRNKIDEDDCCKTRYTDPVDGKRKTCGRLYTDHLHAPPGAHGNISLFLSNVTYCHSGMEGINSKRIIIESRTQAIRFC